MKKIKMLLLIGVCVFTLMGCENQTEEAQSTEMFLAVEEEPDIGDKIEELEEIISSGECQAEDYYALAGLYEQDGSYKKARDILEQCFRLYGDERSLELLAEITVDLKEESDDLNAMISEIVGYMQIGENYDVLLRTIKDDTWISALMPKLKTGSRKYYSVISDDATAYIEVGYGSGSAYSKIYLIDKEQISAVIWQNDSYRILSSGYDGEQYQGEFSLWTLNEKTHEVMIESGTLDNGVLTGSYTASIGSMGDDVAAADFWLTKENVSYKVYTGNFDENGVPTVEQPKEDVISKFLENTDYGTCLVYAYTEDNTKCLWVGDASAITADILKLPEIPTFDTYEVKSEVATQELVAQVRVYDGVVQWYDGSKWVDVASVEDMVQEDPLADGGIRSIEGEETVTAEDSVSNIYNVGSIPSQKESDNAAKKSSGSKNKNTTSTGAVADASATAADTGAAVSNASGSSYVAGNNYSAPSSSGSSGAAASTSTPSASAVSEPASAPAVSEPASAPSTPADSGSSSSQDGEVEWGWDLSD